MQSRMRSILPWFWKGFDISVKNLKDWNGMMFCMKKMVRKTKETIWLLRNHPHELESLQQLVHEITHNYHIETTKGLYCPRSIPYSLTNSGNEYSTLTSRRRGRINLCWFVTIGISCWSHSAQMDHGEAKYQSLGARSLPATILSTNLWIES